MGRVSTEVAEKMVQMRKEGKSVSWIAKEFDTTKATVYARTAAKTPGRKKTTYTTIPLNMPEPSAESRVAMFWGTPKEIGEIVAGLWK